MQAVRDEGMRIAEVADDDFSKGQQSIGKRTDERNIARNVIACFFHRLEIYSKTKALQTVSLVMSLLF